MKKKEKLYYYFCKECRQAIGRDFKKLKHRSYCEDMDKPTILTLITKRKI